MARISWTNVFGLALSGLLCGVATSASAQNLLINGDAEKGDLSGWIAVPKDGFEAANVPNRAI